MFLRNAGCSDVKQFNPVLAAVEITKTGYFCRGSIWRLIISGKINIAHIS
jgi:hypothetical protein